MNNVYGDLAIANQSQPNTAMNTGVASAYSMGPRAMNNLMGNPMANAGANMAPYLNMQQSFMPDTSMKAQASYAQGGYVQMGEGGMPMDQMPQGGGGAMSPLGQMAEGLSTKGPMAESLKETDPEGAPLAELAQSLDLGDDTQLTYINQEELEALTQMGGQPPQMAEEVAPDPEALQQLMQASEGEDYILVYLTQEQFQFLTQNFGEPTINKASGLPQFGFFKKIANVVKKVVSNPIVQAVAPMALNAFAPGLGSAIGGALGLGSMGTSALLSGGLGLLGGGGIKGALKGAAMGAIGQGVGDYLSNGTNPFSGLGDKVSGMFGGTPSSSSGFGLNPSVGTPGINPDAGGVSGIRTPTANSILGSAPKATGLASLIPDSTAGKVALGLGGLGLLGGFGQKKPEQEVASAPPQLPETFSQRLPQLKLERTRLGANYNPYAAQNLSDRTFFSDEYVPVSQAAPVAARHGGYITYADGGNVIPPAPQDMGGGLMGVAPLEEYQRAYSRPAPQRSPMGMGAATGMGGLGGLGGLGSLMGAMSDKDKKRFQKLMQERAMLEGASQGIGRGAGPVSHADLQMMQQGGFAGGGLASLNYARGGIMRSRYGEGGMLEGEGDGTSDDIETSINGEQPALLSDSEYVIPARVVAELGNGSSRAGAKKLDAMVDRIMKKRRMTKDVAHQMDAEAMMPA